MTLKIFLLLFALVYFEVVACLIEYEIFKIIRPEDEFTLKEILEHDGVEFYFPDKTNGRILFLVVSTDFRKEFAEKLAEFNIYQDMVETDVARKFREVSQHVERKRKKRAIVKNVCGKHDGFDFKTYHTYEEMWFFLEMAANENPEIAQITALSTELTTEGNQLKVFQISSPLTQAENKPIIWIEAGIHSREWISPHVAIYIINQLLCGKCNETSVMIEKFNWIFSPTANPDGLKFTQKNVSDLTHRMWRKNRSRETCIVNNSDQTDYNHIVNSVHKGRTLTYTTVNLRCCRGVDLNRNFNFSFENNQSICSAQYAGVAPFSELETRAISDFLTPLKERVKLSLSLHSYSQLWLYPYSDRKDHYPENYEAVRRLAAAATNAMNSLDYDYFNYHIGSMPDHLYPAMGMSHDWAQAQLSVPYSYVIELPPSMYDRSAQFSDAFHILQGFFLDEFRLERTAEELWTGVKIVVENLIIEFA